MARLTRILNGPDRLPPTFSSHSAALTAIRNLKCEERGKIFASRCFGLHSHKCSAKSLLLHPKSGRRQFAEIPGCKSLFPQRWTRSVQQTSSVQAPQPKPSQPRRAPKAASLKPDRLCPGSNKHFKYQSTGPSPPQASLVPSFVFIDEHNSLPTFQHSRPPLPTNHQHNDTARLSKPSSAMADFFPAEELEKRQYRYNCGYNQVWRNGACRQRSRWDSWGRWVLAAILVVVFLLVLCALG